MNTRKKRNTESSLGFGEEVVIVLYKNATEFGKSLGLSEIEMELIQQKKKLIEKLRAARTKKKVSQAQLTYKGQATPSNFPKENQNIDGSVCRKVLQNHYFFKLSHFGSKVSGLYAVKTKVGNIIY